MRHLSAANTRSYRGTVARKCQHEGSIPGGGRITSLQQGRSGRLSRRPSRSFTYLCSKVALADPDADPLEASPFCGGGIDAKRCWRKMLVAPLWQGNIAVTPPSPSKLEQACAKLTSQMFASLFSWVARTCSFNAGDPGCLKVFFEKHRSLSALKGRLWAIPFFKFLSRVRV